MRQQPYVRRIIGGATYNTATSSLLGTANRENVEATLHRTRTGAYFEVRRSERRWHDRRAGEWRTDALIDVVPLDREAASKWCEEHGVMLEADALLEDGGSEATAPASYPLRMPDILKRRLEGEARASGLSLNAFILRRLEAPAKPAINARAASAIKITPAVHPATVLQDEILPSVGMTTNAFAPHIGLSKQAISKSAMKGERLKNDTVHRIAKALGVPALYWLLLQARFDLANFKQEKIADKVKPVDVSEKGCAVIQRRVDAFYAEFEWVLAQARQELAADPVNRASPLPAESASAR